MRKQYKPAITFGTFKDGIPTQGVGGAADILLDGKAVGWIQQDVAGDRGPSRKELFWIGGYSVVLSDSGNGRPWGPDASFDTRGQERARRPWDHRDTRDPVTAAEALKAAKDYARAQILASLAVL